MNAVDFALRAFNAEGIFFTCDSSEDMLLVCDDEE